jgi:hypothetical protein
MSLLARLEASAFQMDLRSLPQKVREELKRSFEKEKQRPKSMELSQEAQQNLEAAINNETMRRL